MFGHRTDSWNGSYRIILVCWRRYERRKHLRFASIGISIWRSASLRICSISSICNRLVAYYHLFVTISFLAILYWPPKLTQVPSPVTPPPAQKEFDTTSKARISSVSVLYSSRTVSQRSLMGNALLTCCPSWVAVYLNGIVFCFVNNVNLRIVEYIFKHYWIRVTDPIWATQEHLRSFLDLDKATGRKWIIRTCCAETPLCPTILKVLGLPCRVGCCATTAWAAMRVIIDNDAGVIEELILVFVLNQIWD